MNLYTLTPNLVPLALRCAAFAIFFGLLQGCATGPNANSADPIEPLNRAVFNFNEGLDRTIIRPVAIAYDKVTPAPIQTGIRNFFGNLGDVVSIFNNALQFKAQDAVETLTRVGINTFFGFGGVLDIASEMQLSKNSQDFGQTLGVWGLQAGPYLVVPLLGPSSVRDIAGRLIEAPVDVLNNAKHVPTRNSITLFRLVDKRASLLEITDALEAAALDRYSFSRDLYLQRRANSITSSSREKEERFDLPEAPAKK